MKTFKQFAEEKTKIQLKLNVGGEPVLVIDKKSKKKGKGIKMVNDIGGEPTLVGKMKKEAFDLKHFKDVFLYKLARGCSGGKIEISQRSYDCAINTIWTGYDAVSRFGITEEEWNTARQLGVIKGQESGWMVDRNAI